jgi:hypothetical protein
MVIFRNSTFRNFIAVPALAAAMGACATEPDDASAVASTQEEIQAGSLETGYPQVGEVYNSAGSYCTGTLISPSVVLTAAHCAGTTLTFKTGTSTSNFVDHAVDRQIAHASKDLLLLHLARPIRDMRPLDINTAGRPAVGTTCIAVGFGAHNESNGTVTKQVKRSATEIVESQNDTTIAVRMVSGVADHGDSGGPLICDGRISAVVHNHTDGDWPTHIRENYATLDAVWASNMTADYTSEAQVATASWGPGRLDQFVRGTDGAVYHKAWENGWYPSATDYEYLGGFTTGTPEVVSWGPNRLDIFVRGGDMALYHKAWNGSAWLPSVTGWENLGGILVSHPTVVSWAANRLDIFGIGMDGALYHKAWNGSAWSGWDYLGGEFQGPIQAVSWGPGRLDVFGTGMDNALYHKAWENRWYPSDTGFDYLGGGILGAPSVTSWGPGRFDVFVKGTDNALYHKAWENGHGWWPSQTDYDYLGGGIIGSPASASWGPGRLDVVVEGMDGAMYHKAWDSSHGWYPNQYDYDYLGGGLAGTPSIVSWASGRIDMFVTGTDFAMYHKAWESGHGWWPNQTDYDYLGGILSW